MEKCAGKSRKNIRIQKLLFNHNCHSVKYMVWMCKSRVSFASLSRFSLIESESKFHGVLRATLVLVSGNKFQDRTRVKWLFSVFPSQFPGLWAALDSHPGADRDEPFCHTVLNSVLPQPKLLAPSRIKCEPLCVVPPVWLGAFAGGMIRCKGYRGNLAASSEPVIVGSDF